MQTESNIAKKEEFEGKWFNQTETETKERIQETEVSDKEDPTQFSGVINQKNKPTEKNKE